MPSDVESVLSGYFQAVLDALKDGVYISDRDGKTVCVNRAYEQLTGLRSEDLVGRSVQELIQRGVFGDRARPGSYLAMRWRDPRIWLAAFCRALKRFVSRETSPMW